VEDCTYCGVEATTRDHLVPVTTRVGGRRNRSGSFPGERVPACVDCNCRILGAVLLFTVEERRQFVAGRLKARLARSKPARWSPEELEELGHGLLRQSVEAGLRERELLVRRYAFASAPVST
jgi:hypothetical protein